MDGCAPVHPVDIKSMINLAESSITEVFTKPDIGSSQFVGIKKIKLMEIQENKI